MGLFGYPDDIQQDFSFDPSYASYSPSSGLLRGIGDLQDTAGKQKRLGGEFSQAYRQMLDPGSAYYQRMFGELRKGVGDTAAQTRVGMNQALASRGVGQGGMSSLLGSATMNTAGEQMRKGSRVFKALVLAMLGLLEDWLILLMVQQDKYMDRLAGYFLGLMIEL